MATPRFKVGDKVRVISNTCYHNKEIGDIVTLTKEWGDGAYLYDNRAWLIRTQDIEPLGNGSEFYTFYSSGKSMWIDNGLPGYEETIEKYLTLKTKKSPMKTLSTMFKKLVDKDVATLAKAEYINGDLELTSEGWLELKAMLFEANKAALIARAQEKLDEASKKA